MRDDLRRALTEATEDRPFHGTTVTIRHLTANQRLSMAKQYAAGEVEDDTAIRFWSQLVVLGVVGVEESDAAALRDASVQRLQELAELVMSVNKINANVEMEAKN